VDYLRNLWVADKVKSSVLYLSKERDTWNSLFKITGREYVQGYRDGNIDKATFNMTTSICVYDQNRTKILLARSLKPIYMFQNMTNNRNCTQFMTKENYTSSVMLIVESTINDGSDSSGEPTSPDGDNSNLDPNKQANNGGGGGTRRLQYASTD
jgi:hypothetical protein